MSILFLSFYCAMPVLTSLVSIVPQEVDPNKIFHWKYVGMELHVYSLCTSCTPSFYGFWHCPLTSLHIFGNVFFSLYRMVLCMMLPGTCSIWIWSFRRASDFTHQPLSLSPVIVLFCIVGTKHERGGQKPETGQGMTKWLLVASPPTIMMLAKSMYVHTCMS